MPINCVYECVEYELKQQLLLLMVSYRCRSRCRYCLVLGAVLHLILLVLLLLLLLLHSSLFILSDTDAYMYHCMCLTECSGVDISGTVSVFLAFDRYVHCRTYECECIGCYLWTFPLCSTYVHRR